MRRLWRNNCRAKQDSFFSTATSQTVLKTEIRSFIFHVFLFESVLLAHFNVVLLQSWSLTFSVRLQPNTSTHVRLQDGLISLNTKVQYNVLQIFLKHVQQAWLQNYGHALRVEVCHCEIPLTSTSCTLTLIPIQHGIQCQEYLINHAPLLHSSTADVANRQ